MILWAGNGFPPAVAGLRSDSAGLHPVGDRADNEYMQILAPEPVGAIDGLPDLDRPDLDRPDLEKPDLERFANPIRVLVVDDSPTDAEIVAKLLEGGPYSCATVTSYEEGVELISRQAHDAYLIDY